MWTHGHVCQMFCTAAFPHDPQETAETQDDQPPRGTEGTGAGTMEEQHVVVLGVLHVCFFFAYRSRCALCCAFCASYVSASALPLEDRRDIFRVLHELPPETKGEQAEQGCKKATKGASAGAEVSAGGDGGPAGAQVCVVVSLLFARQARMVLLRLWNPPRLVLRMLRVICVLILAHLRRTPPLFPCSADGRASQGGAPGLPKTPCRSGRGSTYGDGTRGQDDRWRHCGNLTPHGEFKEGWVGEGLGCYFSPLGEPSPESQWPDPDESQGRHS